MQSTTRSAATLLGLLAAALYACSGADDANDGGGTDDANDAATGTGEPQRPPTGSTSRPTLDGATSPDDATADASLDGTAADANVVDSATKDASSDAAPKDAAVKDATVVDASTGPTLVTDAGPYVPGSCSLGNLDLDKTLDVATLADLQAVCAWKVCVAGGYNLEYRCDRPPPAFVSFVSAKSPAECTAVVPTPIVKSPCSLTLRDLVDITLAARTCPASPTSAELTAVSHLLGLSPTQCIPN